MKLKYKISLIIIFIGVLVLGSVSIIYSYWSYQDTMEDEQTKLISTVKSTAHLIELELYEKLSITKTIGSAPIIFETLINSNNRYKLLSETQQQNKIKQLNSRWKEAKDADDSFIKPYLNNPLALYLKYQQKVLPGVYGEIFITNRYGAMVATTGKLSTLAHAQKYWWKEGYNNGKGRVFFDDRGFDKSVKGYVVGVVIPIKKDGKVIGILKTNVNIIGTLNNVVEHYSKLNHGNLKIVRTKGLIVLEDGEAPLSTTINKELLKPLKSMKTGFIINGNDIAAYTPVKLTLDSSDMKFGNKPNKIDHLKGNKDEAWHAVIKYSKEQALVKSKEINQIIIYIGASLTLFLLLAALYFGRWISSPIINLSKIAIRIGKGEHNLRAKVNTNDEVAILAESFNNMLDDLHKTMASRDELLKEIAKRKHVQNEIIEKDKIMIAQSHHAAMGEMIGNIAHQWRQPLNAVNVNIENLEFDYEDGVIDKEFLDKFIVEQTKTLQFMSKTIDDFRNFFRIKKEKKAFSIKKAIENSVNIQISELNKHDITLNIKGEDFIIDGFENEFLQVMMNLISNAKDAIIQHKQTEQKDGLIGITLFKNSITVTDNGGGIPNDIIGRIFEPYYTTKEQGKGTGMGLYMSKMIIEDNMGGKLYVKNENGGAVFIIKLEVADEL